MAPTYIQSHNLNIRYILRITTKSFQATKESFIRKTTHFLNEYAITFDVFDSVYWQNHWKKMASKFEVSERFSSTFSNSHKKRYSVRYANSYAFVFPRWLFYVFKHFLVETIYILYMSDSNLYPYPLYREG